MVGVAGHSHAQAVFLCQADRVPAADRGNLLPQPMVAVIQKASPRLRDDASVGVRIDVAREQLVYVGGEEQNPMRIDPAQVCRDKRFGD